MKHTICILVILLSAPGISAQTNILKDWKIKYNAPLAPEKVKYYPKRDSLYVTYHSQMVVDTVSVFYDSIVQFIRFQRRMKVQTTRSFTRDMVRQTEKVVSGDVQYYQITDAGGLVLVIDTPRRTGTHYYDSNIASGRRMHYLLAIDSIRTDSSVATYVGNEQVFRIHFFTDTSLSLREIKNTTIGSLDPSNFYVGIFYTPSAAFRSITIEEPQFADLDALNDRHDAETNRYGHAISLQLGYNYGRHTVYGEYLHLRQGFNSTKQAVDWQTGLPAASTGQSKYVFSNMGFGIGYNYSGYGHFVNGIIELGAYYNFFDVYYQDTTTFTTDDVVKQYTNPMRAAGLRKNVFGLKAGLGFCLRPTFRWEIRLMPTIYYNLTPANNGTLETRLYNVGLTMGVGWRIGTKANGKIYY